MNARLEPLTPLSVLLVGSFLQGTGGTRSVAEELAEQLRRSGCRVTTTSSAERRLPRLLDMLATTWRERERYAVAQVDVFSGPAFRWAEAVCAALTLARKPYVLSLHGGNLPRFASERRRRVDRLLRSASVVTTPSRYLLDAFSGHGNIRFIPNGIDVSAYPCRIARGARPAIVWMRAYHECYNPSLAIRVLSLLALRYPDVHLTMIGADKRDGARQATEALACALGVRERVDLGDAVPKGAVPHALRTGDIFLNTTTVDNAPVSVLEAMACGLCVVSTNVGGVPYLVDDGQDGLLVPPGNPDAMAHAVARILDNPDLADLLSRNARRKAECFDWSPIIDEWRALFLALATNDGGVKRFRAASPFLPVP